MEPELSIPVIWAENGASPLAGRLDVHADRLHLDGGSRAARRTRDVDYDEIVSARIGRATTDRMNGRPAIVLELARGRRLSFVGFDRPGTLVELLHRVEQRVGYPSASAGLA
jgi:hypothetical protein